jgi:hypothetical protein
LKNQLNYTTGDIENASKELGNHINKMPMNKPNNNCCLGFGTNM